MSKVYCRICGKIHDRKEKCVTDVKKDNKKDLRKTARWQRLREDVLEEYNYIDIVAYAVCGRIVVATSVHHIEGVREREDLIFNEDNLICVCEVVHKNIEGKYKEYLKDLKRRWKEGKITLGCDEGVIPLDIF